MEPRPGLDRRTDVSSPARTARRLALLLTLVSAVVAAVVGLTSADSDLRCLDPEPGTSSRGDTVRVPTIEAGSSVEEALRVLSGAGLEGCVPQVGFPHYATGTDPAVGTTVSHGTRVTIQIGDG